MGLYAAFIDLTKALTKDTVSQDALWNILMKLGCPLKILTIIQQLHDGQQGQVKLSSDLSDSFPVRNGVKQGCVLASMLFAIFFSIRSQAAKVDLTDGIYIRFRTDASVFYLRCLSAQTTDSPKSWVMCFECHGSCTESISGCLSVFINSVSVPLWELSCRTSKQIQKFWKKRPCPALRAGHVLRMNDERLPKALFYGELCQGMQALQGPAKETVDESLY